MTAPDGIGSLLDVERLGQRGYAEAYARQEELLAKRIAGEVRDTLILVEHDPVITVGSGAKVEEFEGLDLPVVEISRGGEATYHGPGQVVAYPIYALPEGRRDLHRYLRDLEEVLIRVLGELDIEGRRNPDATGVWIGDQKVASIGVAVRSWVTWHGLALNVNTDLDVFQSFKPCGLSGDVMTRLADHAAVPPANLLFEVLIVKHFLEVFGLDLPAPPVSESGFPDLPILPS